MFQPLALFIGLRYTRAKRRNQFISFVSLISLLGMILGVVALVVVLSVMNGFEAELRNRILSVVPHGYLRGPEQRLSDWQQWQQQISGAEGVLASAPYVAGNIMVSRPGITRGANLQAIDPQQEAAVSNIDSSMVQGRLEDLRAGEFGMVLGASLARYLGVYLGDEISVILPKVTVTPLGIFPRVKRFRVVGVFQVGADLDGNTVFIHLGDGQKLFQLGRDVNGLRLQLEDLFQADQRLNQLLVHMPNGSSVLSWAQTQGSLFKAVKMEKTIVSLLLMIIVVIAAFNIISILTMMVADKRSDIAVLRTMGAAPSTIRHIFMIQGMAVGLSGIAVGIAIGVPLALNTGDIVIGFEQLFGAEVFNPDVYYISRIPSVLEWKDVAWIAACGLLLSLLATVYPAMRAARIEPAEALRYE